jgi:5-methylthioadenosine/S-adenosylhomocysteine deaminase
MIDVLIENGWVSSLDAGFHRFAPGWVAVRADRIEALGEGPTPRAVRERARRIIAAHHKILIPGFVNSHTHLSQTFMRGLADDRPLASWLSVIQRLQAAMTAEDMRLASMLGLVENLRSGVTTVVQHHKITQSREHVEVTLQVAEQVGIRMLFARGWRDSGARGERPESIASEMSCLFHRWHGRADGRLRIAFGPMEPRRCSGATMQRFLAVAREWGVPTHMHVAETADEVADFDHQVGMSPIAWLDSLGGLGPDVMLVHCVQVTDHDLDLIARHGATVVHCPISNMRLASGIAPLNAMLARGIPVCLGTDGAAGSSQDMLETLKVAALLAKIATGDAAAVATADLLQMATATGAGVLGFAGVGGLAIGRKADITVIDLNTACSMPVHRPESALIYCTAAQVHSVLVDGRILLDAGRVTVPGLDEAALLTASRDAGARLVHRAGLTCRRVEPLAPSAPVPPEEHPYEQPDRVLITPIHTHRRDKDARRL